MITYLELRNWRAFDKVALHLDPGTSFIVAENGIGKTSILRGAAWSLFGSDNIDPAPELRTNHGATEAVGIIAATTPIGELEIERIHRVGRGTKPSVSATLAGREIASEELPDTLARVFGAHPSIAAQLGFVHQHALISDQALFTGVKTFLRHLTGVSRLDASRTALLKTQKALDRRAAGLNKQAKARGAEADELEADRVHATAALEQAESALARTRANHESTRAAAELREQWHTYRNEVENFHAIRSQLLDEISEFSKHDEVASTLAELRSASSDLNHHLAQANATAELHDQLIAQLTGESICPVCRQTVDDDQAQVAMSHHREAIDNAIRSGERLELELDAIRGRLENVTSIGSQLDALVEPMPPSHPEPELSSTYGGIETSAESVKSALSYTDKCRADLAAIDRAIRAAQKDTTAHDDLIRTRRLEAAAIAAVDVLDRSIRHHVTTRIDPLSDALAQGWGQFFTTEGSLTLTDEGEINMHLLDGTTLEYPQLSGGQQALAILTLRLALIASATTLGTVWLDEPLEHLDPINRRRAANLLSQVSRNPPHPPDCCNNLRRRNRSQARCPTRPHPIALRPVRLRATQCPLDLLITPQ